MNLRRKARRVHAIGWRHPTRERGPAPTDEARGRSRCGPTAEIHLACDGKARLLAVVLTEGQRHASTQLEAVLNAVRVPRHGGRGHPRKRPDHLIADKG